MIKINLENKLIAKILRIAVFIWFLISANKKITIKEMWVISKINTTAKFYTPIYR